MLSCSRSFDCAILINFYRPQRSWAKVIFSEACVKNSVHGGGLKFSGGVLKFSGEGLLQIFGGVSFEDIPSSEIWRQFLETHTEDENGCTHPSAMLSCSRSFDCAILINFYRPQRSWAKVIFSEACVKNSVHGGGSEIFGGVLKFSGGVCSKFLGGCLNFFFFSSKFLSPQKNSPGMHPPMTRSMRGRYASYWNAFLFMKVFGICKLFPRCFQRKENPLK